MAEIRSFVIVRHLRAEASAHVLLHRGGALRKSLAGASFWFFPLSASLAEVPVDDREIAFVFHGRTIDFQDVTVQGIVTYRVEDPLLLARRVDFAIDPRSGLHTKQPLEKISLLLTELAGQHAMGWVATVSLREALGRGTAEIRARVEGALSSDEGVTALGLAIASVRVAAVKPTPDLERALEAKVRESIQQEADEAAFARRALAVEKERAIQENELQNQIELAKREEDLLAQQGQNAQRKATDEVEAKRIASEGEALRSRMAAATQAETVRVVEGARVEAEKARMEIYREMPVPVLAGMAARELAQKLHTIEHLTIAPDAFGPMLERLLGAGTRALEAKKEE